MRPGIPAPKKGEQKMTDKVIENNQVIIMGKVVTVTLSSSRLMATCCKSR